MATSGQQGNLQGSNQTDRDDEGRAGGTGGGLAAPPVPFVPTKAPPERRAKYEGAKEPQTEEGSRRLIEVCRTEIATAERCPQNDVEGAENDLAILIDIERQARAAVNDDPTNHSLAAALTAAIKRVAEARSLLNTARHALQQVKGYAQRAGSPSWPIVNEATIDAQAWAAEVSVCASGVADLKRNSVYTPN
jgi:hypothetical protein